MSTHHRLVIEDHTFACSHGGSGSRELAEDEERLALHLWTFHSDDIDQLAISREQYV